MPCTLRATVKASETAATASSANGPKAKGVTLGKGKFRIAKKGTQQLTIKLSTVGRRYLKGKSGRLKATLAVTQKVGGDSVVTKRPVSVKVLPRGRSAR
ncbi:MAG TPA: hypothetical protein VGC32_12850 [Solirubrobacterales bacterium]